MCVCIYCHVTQLNSASNENTAHVESNVIDTSFDWHRIEINAAVQPKAANITHTHTCAVRVRCSFSVLIIIRTHAAV